MATRKRQTRRVRDRLHGAGAPALGRCSVPGCDRLPEARQGSGLSPILCRYHREFRSRHGSAWQRSLTGREVRPYIEAAESYLRARQDDAIIGLVVRAIGQALISAGRVPSVADLPVMPPSDKARGVIARLREEGVPPIRFLAVTIGVLAAVEEQYAKPGGDYARVNIAKALKRRASGHHVVYASGVRWDFYPESRGRFLIELGEIALRLCGPVIQRHLKPILAEKVARYGALRTPSKPPAYPASRFGSQRVKPPAARRVQGPLESLPAPDALQELKRYADGLKAEAQRLGFKAFDGKF